MTDASLGIVTFRRHPGGVDNEALLDRMNAGLADQIQQQGDVFVSTARVRGRLVLRLCILNHSTSQAEVDRALELVATLPVDSAFPAAAVRESYPPIQRGWLRRTALTADALRSLPLFAALDDGRAGRVLLAAHEHHVAAGDAVIDQWQVSRDMFVVLEGAVEVSADGLTLTTCGPGEFFGELAAIDWGAGFGRTRSATVTATTSTRLLVLDWTLVNWLNGADATFAEELTRVSQERLARH